MTIKSRVFGDRLRRYFYGAIAFGVTSALISCGSPIPPTPTPALSDEHKALFFHHIIDAAPPGGNECCTDVAALGDINGDGFLDLVIGGENAQDAGLVWYEYPTWKRHNISKGQFTTDGEIIDFDGDGDADIVVGDIDAGLTWFEQVAEGKTWVRHALSPGYVHDLRVADIDRNGINDIVLSDKKRLLLIQMTDDLTVANTSVLLERDGEGLEIADVDADGDDDILFSHLLLEQSNLNPAKLHWNVVDIAPEWSADTRIQAADVNQDGRLDVILTASEASGRVIWLERPHDPVSSAWIPHNISTQALNGAHTLEASDFDNDGDIDILVAEMHTSQKKRVQIFSNNGSKWTSLSLATHGSHNMAVGDIDRDGDVDLIGKNYAGPDRFVEFWENRAAELRFTPNSLSITDTGLWEYRAFDGSRPMKDSQTFGLLADDLNSDGSVDIVAGGTLYLSNGKSSTLAFDKVPFAAGADAIHTTDYKIHGWRTIIAVTTASIEQYAADGPGAEHWIRLDSKPLPTGRTQGWASIPVGPNSAERLFFTHGVALYQLDLLPSSADSLNVRSVVTGVQEEAVVVGNLDGNDYPDVIVIDGSGRQLTWLESRDGELSFKRHLGNSNRWLDRLALADINNDGRVDIVFTEESRDLDYNSRVGWLESPDAPDRDPWLSHTVLLLRSANSLTVTDIDGDGDSDIVIAEHTAFRNDSEVIDNYTGLLLNNGSGNWKHEMIEIGAHSSHLGAKTADINNDGIMEVLSISWGQSCCIHSWMRSTGW